MAESSLVLYWDTSALLSYFFTDLHSAIAQKYVKAEGVHLLSSLAHAEACAVVAGMAKQATINRHFAKTVRTAFDNDPWRTLNGYPDRKIVGKLSPKWSLRGADLWHLSLAVSLRRDLPEIKLLTFDKQLFEAASGEGVAAPTDRHP
jgi:predicted nucleic acid-binding protein